MNRHALIPGSGWDCPPEYATMEGSREWDQAERQLFEETVGDDCEGAMGYGRPAEKALRAWLARMMKAPECFKPDFAALGAELWPLISAWQGEVYASLDRDEIEKLAEDMVDDYWRGGE